jgi:hypothetical protein
VGGHAVGGVDHLDVGSQWVEGVEHGGVAAVLLAQALTEAVVAVVVRSQRPQAINAVPRVDGRCDKLANYIDYYPSHNVRTFARYVQER